MPVCIDPSHSVGSRSQGQKASSIYVTARGVVAGANMILVNFHPEPTKALVDGPQACFLWLRYFLKIVAHETYENASLLAKFE